LDGLGDEPPPPCDFVGVGVGVPPPLWVGVLEVWLFDVLLLLPLDDDEDPDVVDDDEDVDDVDDDDEVAVKYGVQTLAGRVKLAGAA
jgi:hypothetical protein